MDHIPLVKGSTLRNFRVPIVCEGFGDVYDGLGFHDFPFRKGWCTVDDEFGWMECSVRELNVRAQSWLYFGLLFEFFDEDFKRDVFVRYLMSSSPALGHEPFLNTAELEKLAYGRLNHLLKPVHSWSLARYTRNYAMDKALTCCDTVARHVEALDEHAASLKEQGVSACDDAEVKSLLAITLSVKLLVEVLDRVKHRYYRIIDSVKKTTIRSYRGLIPRVRHIQPARLVFQFAQDAKWCPFQAKRFASQLSTTTMCYLLSLSSPGTAGQDHENCPLSGEKCIANHVSMDTYITKHVKVCQMALRNSDSSPLDPPTNEQCEMLGVDTRHLVRIIRNGGTPLIEFGEPMMGSNCPKLKLVHGGPKDRYIAISHVWSGGLGNPRANKLPACQVRELYDTLKSVQARDFTWSPFQRTRKLQLAGKAGHDPFSYFMAFIAGNFPQAQPLRFWMDTLCIPVGSENGAWRSHTINNMAAIYVQAQSMLVLDESLRSSFPTGEDELEQDAQILCSPWMSRAWTLQEAALGLNRYIQVTDNKLIASFESKESHLYRPDHVLTDGQTIYPNEQEGHFDDLYAFFRNMQTATSPVALPDLGTSACGAEELAEVIRFTKVWNSLSGRTTTMPEDLHVIIATLLGFSPHEVLNLPAEERMKAIIRTQSQLPLALLYEEGLRLGNKKSRDSPPKYFPDDSPDNWVITAPANGSHLDLMYGIMSKSPDGSLLISCGSPSLHNPEFDSSELMAFLLNEPLPEQFWLLHPATDTRVYIELCSLATGEPERESGLSILLIHKYFPATNLRGSEKSSYLPKGAVLRVSVEQGSTWECTYHCPVRAWAHSIPSFQKELPEFRAVLLPENSNFEIRSNINSWPTLNYKRSSSIFQFGTNGIKSYTAILSFFWFWCSVVFAVGRVAWWQSYIAPFDLAKQVLGSHPPPLLSILLWFFWIPFIVLPFFVVMMLSFILIRAFILFLEICFWLHQTRTPFHFWISGLETKPDEDKVLSKSDELFMFFELFCFTSFTLPLITITFCVVGMLVSIYEPIYHYHNVYRIPGKRDEKEFEKFKNALLSGHLLFFTGFVVETSLRLVVTFIAISLWICTPQSGMRKKSFVRIFSLLLHSIRNQRDRFFGFTGSSVCRLPHLLKEAFWKITQHFVGGTDNQALLEGGEIDDVQSQSNEDEVSDPHVTSNQATKLLRTRTNEWIASNVVPWAQSWRTAWSRWYRPPWWQSEDYLDTNPEIRDVEDVGEIDAEGSGGVGDERARSFEAYED